MDNNELKTMGNRDETNSYLTPQIFIGQNHTGSWSFSEAMKGMIKQEDFIEIESYTFVSSANEMPSLHQDIKMLQQYFEHASIPKFIYAHRPIPAHVALNKTVQEKATYFTLMRDPVSRFLSCYFWLVKHKHAEVHWVPEIIKNGASLDVWIDYLIDNNMRPGGMWPGEYFYQAWLDLGLVPENIGMKRDNVVNFVLDTYFSFIGITEFFDESLYIFSKKFGYESLPTWTLLGNSDRPPISEISSTVIDKIENLVSMDMIIYEKCKKRFLTNYKDDIDYFRKNIKTLRANADVNLQPII